MTDKAVVRRPRWQPWRRSTPARPLRGQALAVASADALARHGRLIVTHLDTSVLLVRTRRGVFAIENRCPHLGAPLAEATLTAGTITCPMHDRRFDLRTGECLTRAAARPVRTWPAWVADGHVWLAAAR